MTICKTDTEVRRSEKKLGNLEKTSVGRGREGERVAGWKIWPRGERRGEILKQQTSVTTTQALQWQRQGSKEWEHHVWFAESPTATAAAPAPA